MKYTAKQIAEYFLALVYSEEGDNLTNLKLQKLLYYAQGFNLAIHEEPLFEEPVKAWMYGPAVPSIYQTYQEYGSNGIECPVDFDFDLFDEDTQQLLSEIYDVYGQYTASTLMQFTHEELPWKSTERDDEISRASMVNYFATQLK